MAEIIVPADGRPDGSASSEDLLGIDGNAFAILGTTRKLLKRAGASPDYVAAFTAAATSGDYDNLIATAVAFLDAE